MGCWNGTCGLSKLPIKYDEKIILVPIVKNTESIENIGGGFCYSTDLYEPLTYPLMGKYNDYGSIKDVENGKIAYDFFMLKYKRKTKEIVEKTKEDFPESIEGIIDFIKEGYFPDLSFMMFHDSVYRKVINEYSCRKSYQTEFNYFTMRQFLEVQALRFIEGMKEMHPYKQYCSSISGFFANNFSNKFKEYMRYFLDQLVALEDNTLFNDMIDLYLFDSALDIARYIWIPQSGSGSTSEDCVIQQIISNFVIEKIGNNINDTKREPIIFCHEN